MARPRKPLEINKKHFTKSEIEQRKAETLDVPFTDVTPPEYLTKNQKKKFLDIAGKLDALGIMTELDVDCLAMYVLSHDLYLLYTKRLSKLIEAMEFEKLKDIQNMQDKAFRQAQAAASKLGLTITDRCRIVIPPPPEDDNDEL